MKKLILIVLIGLLSFLTYSAFTSGLDIGSQIHVPSYQEIVEGNQQLDSSEKELDTLIDRTYANQRKDVESAKTDFNYKKNSYDALAANATDEQLEAAMKEEEYLLDYLWILIGNYSNDNNVKFLMNVNSDDTIDFDVTGSYIAIDNFLYDLANDPELRFLIDNIQLEGGSNRDSTTKAKFKVAGIKVITKSEA